MAKGAIASEGSGGEAIHHITGIRLRVTGSGSLQPKFYSLDDLRSYTLVPMNMSSTPGRTLDRLANVTEQRAFLELKTTEINEIMRINRIIVWLKPVAAEFPG